MLRPASGGCGGGYGRRGGRRGTRVRIVFAALVVGGRRFDVGGRGSGSGSGVGGRPGALPDRRRARPVARVGALRRGGQVVQEVKVGDGLALLVAEPDEKIGPAHD